MDEIWSKYDDDNSGELDKEEAKLFVQDTLAGVDAESNGFSDEDFDACFLLFDKDGSGSIDKSEMVQFIIQVAGLGPPQSPS